MVANRVNDGLYMTVEQYLALDESSDAKYEYIDGYVFMLRPPSSEYDDQVLDMAGGSVLMQRSAHVWRSCWAMP